MQILLLLQEQDVEETHGLGKKPNNRVQSNQQVTADTDRFSLFFFFFFLSTSGTNLEEIQQKKL